jgi:hypothetical protein
MSNTIPPSEELRQRIRARVAELRALRHLHRLARAAENARAAESAHQALEPERPDPAAIRRTLSARAAEGQGVSHA